MTYMKKNKPVLEVEFFNFQRACVELLPQFISINGPDHSEVYRLVAQKLMGGSFRISYVNSNYESRSRMFKDVIDDDAIDCLKYMRKMLPVLGLEEISKESFEERQNLPVHMLDKDNIFLWDKKTDSPVTEKLYDSMEG